MSGKFLMNWNGETSKQFFKYIEFDMKDNA